VYAEEFLAKSLDAQPVAESKRILEIRAEAQELFHIVCFTFTDYIVLRKIFTIFLAHCFVDCATVGRIIPLSLYSSACCF
jgi:hypothetical protein